MVKATRFILTLGLTLFVSMSFAQFGGPYVADENTVVLMHFDSEATILENSATTAGALNGVAYGSLSLLNSSEGPRPDLGSSLLMSNASITDSNHIEIPHYDDLGLTGDFTIEGWMSPETYVASGDGWSQRAPSVITKGISNQNGNNNTYQVTFNGVSHNLTGMTKYADGAWNDWVEVWSPSNSIALFEWYHFALIRDTATNTLTMLVHNAAGELLSANTSNDPLAELGRALEQNTYPLYIGSAPNWNDASLFYNGAVDEIRISDVVRPYEIPIGFTSIIGENVAAGESPVIEITIVEIAGSTVVGSPVVHYSTDGGSNWTDLSSTATAEASVYEATLPTGAFGEEIYYYTTAANAAGQVTISPADAEDAVDPAYDAVGFWNAEEIVLDLSFDDGSGNPADASALNNAVTLNGANAEYSTDVPAALAGISTHSLAINMDLGGSYPDTAYVETPDPNAFLNGNDRGGWTIDLWAKVHGQAFDSGNNHSQIWVWGGPVGTLRYVNWGTTMVRFSANTNFGPESVVDVVLPGGEYLDVWYHFKGTTDANGIYLYVYDENDDEVARGETMWDTDNGQELLAHQSGPFRFGYTDGDTDDLFGYIDEVKFYNYPAFRDTSATGPEYGELIANGEFDDGFASWNQAAQQGATADYTIDATAQLSGDNSAQVSITNSTGTNWHIQLSTPLHLWDATRYIVTWTAKASSDLDILYGFQQSHDPYGYYHEEGVASLTTTAQTFVDTIDMVVEDDVVLTYMLGTLANGDQVWFDAVSVVEMPGPAPPVEIIANGEFDDGLNGWGTEIHDGAAVATFEVDATSQLSGENSAKVDVTASTGTQYHVQINQSLHLVAGAKYIIEFQAKASETINVEWGFQMAHDPYGYHPEAHFTDFTTEAQTFRDTIDMAIDDDVKLTWMLGNVGAVQFWLDAVSVMEVREGEVPDGPAGQMLTNVDFDDGLLDWNVSIGGGTADITVDDGSVLSGANSAHTVITESPNVNWQVQLQYPGLSVVEGMQYALTFSVVSTVEAEILAGVQRNGDPYDMVASADILIGPEATTYTLESIAGADMADAYVTFMMGNIGVAEVWIDAVTLIEQVPIIANDEFDDGLTGWATNIFDGNATATFDVDAEAGMSGDNAARVEVTNSTGTNWAIQLAHGLQVTAGKQYTVMYDIKASADVDVEVWLQQNHADYASFIEETANVTTESQSFIHRSIAPEDDGINLIFALGNIGNVTVWVDNVAIIEEDPTYVVVGLDDGLAGLPMEFKLSQNYPNPFNPTTTINFAVPANDVVNLEVFDILGRNVVTLIDSKEVQAGNYSLQWDGNNNHGKSVASGVYMYRMSTVEGHSAVKKMVLVR